MSNTDELATEYKIRQDWYEEQRMLHQKQMQIGGYEFKLEELPNRYAPEGYSDEQLFDEVFSRKNTIESYPTYIQRVIDRAYININEFNAIAISPDSYTYQYQLRVIDMYKNVQSVFVK